MDKVNDLFKITYENGISNINMVIETRMPLRFINYQYEMLTNNDCKGIMPINSRQKDEHVYLYCDITSRLSLTQYLKGRRLSKEEFIGIISSIIETILSSKGYLLYERSFLFDKDYIYIKPGTSDVQLAYLPFDLSNSVDSAVKKLFIDLIMTSDFEEISDDNFLQRILSNVKSETFCLNELHKLLKEISYDAATDNSNLACQDNSDAVIQDEKKQLTQNKKVISIGWGFFTIVLLQIIICFSLFTLLKSDLITDTLIRYATCSVIIALDLIVTIRFTKKLPTIKTEEMSVSEVLHKKVDLTELPFKEQENSLMPEDSTMLLSVNDISRKEDKLPYACLQCNRNGVLEEINITKKLLYFWETGWAG